MVRLNRSGGKSAREVRDLIGLLADDPQDRVAAAALGRRLSEHPGLIKWVPLANGAGGEWAWFHSGFCLRVSDHARREEPPALPATAVPGRTVGRTKVRVLGREAMLMYAPQATTSYIQRAGFGGPFVPVLLHGPSRLLVIDAAGTGDGSTNRNVIIEVVGNGTVHTFRTAVRA